MPSDVAKRLRALEAEITEEYGIGHPWAHELAAIRVEVEAVAALMLHYSCWKSHKQPEHIMEMLDQWADRLAKGKP